MSAFTKFDSDASIRYAHKASDLYGRDYYYLADPFVYYVDNYPSEVLVKVPAGFLTDGASIPRLFWSWASPIGRHAQSAILHDYLCEYLSVIVDGENTPITRAHADLIFKESLLVLGVSKARANLMYAGVSAYRKVKRIKDPSFIKEKFYLEETMRDRIINERCQEGDEVCRINTRKRLL